MLDCLTIPRNSLALCSKSRWFDRREEVLGPNSAFVLFDGQRNDLEEVVEIRSFRRCVLESFVPPHEQHRQQDVDDAWKKKGQPKANILLDISCSDHEKSTNINAHIEDQHDPLNGGLRIYDDPLARLECLDMFCLVGILVDDERNNIRLEQAGSDCQQKEADNERRKTIAGFENSRSCASNHDNVCRAADDDSIYDCSETAGLGIAEPCTKDWDYIGKEVKQENHGRGKL
ncbi:hypothetical protein HG530_007971 [Fusarium avenaceum]|nr:hypothetical protein HG530_007971 [Fusarium avenaceum]